MHHTHNTTTPSLFSGIRDLFKSRNTNSNPSLSGAKYEAIARLPTFSENTKKVILGLALLILGLALIPFTGTTSLIMVIPGLAMAIPTSVGIGVGSGLCGLGVAELLFHSGPAMRKIGTWINTSRINGLEQTLNNITKDELNLVKKKTALNQAIRNADSDYEALRGESRTMSETLKTTAEADHQAKRRGLDNQLRELENNIGKLQTLRENINIKLQNLQAAVQDVEEEEEEEVVDNKSAHPDGPPDNRATEAVGSSPNGSGLQE